MCSYPDGAGWLVESAPWEWLVPSSRLHIVTLLVSTGKTFAILLKSRMFSMVGDPLATVVPPCNPALKVKILLLMYTFLFPIVSFLPPFSLYVLGIEMPW